MLQQSQLETAHPAAATGATGGGGGGGGLCCCCCCCCWCWRWRRAWWQKKRREGDDGMAWQGMDGWMDGGGPNRGCRKTGITGETRRSHQIKVRDTSRPAEGQNRRGCSTSGDYRAPACPVFCRDAGEMNRLWFPSERFSVNPSTTTTPTTTHLARHGGQASLHLSRGWWWRAGGRLRIISTSVGAREGGVRRPGCRFGDRGREARTDGDDSGCSYGRASWHMGKQETYMRTCVGTLHVGVRVSE